MTGSPASIVVLVTPKMIVYHADRRLGQSVVVTTTISINMSENDDHLPGDAISKTLIHL